MFDFWFLVLSLPLFALAWRGVEWIVFRLVRAKENAPRYVTLIYDVLAVGGGIVLAASQVGMISWRTICSRCPLTKWDNPKNAQ